LYHIKEGIHEVFYKTINASMILELTTANDRAHWFSTIMLQRTSLYI